MNELLSARQVLAEPWGSSSLLSRTPTCGSSHGQGIAGAGTEAPKPREKGLLFQVSRKVRDGPASWLRERRPGLPSAGPGVCGPFPHTTGERASSGFACHGSGAPASSGLLLCRKVIKMTFYNCVDIKTDPSQAGVLSLTFTSFFCC